MRGQRGRIGFLWPADGLNDDEYWSYLPVGVSWLTARYTPDLGSEALTISTIEAYADPALLAHAARLLQAVKPHVIACGDNAASIVNGVAGDRAIRMAVEKATGVAVATPGSSILAALDRLGAKRLAVISPYPKDLSDRLVGFLHQAGHWVSDLIVIPEDDEWGIGLALPCRWAEAVGQLDLSLADAIVVAGGGVRLFGVIGDLENEHDRPIVAAPASLVWHACQLAGFDVRQAGDGTLYRDFGTPPTDAGQSIG